MTTLSDDVPVGADRRPLLIAAAPVSEARAGARPDRVVVRLVRDNERAAVLALARPPGRARSSAGAPQLVTAVVALAGSELVGAAAAYWSGGGTLSAAVGVRPSWREIGVGAFLGRSLARALRELGTVAEASAGNPGPAGHQADGRAAEPARPRPAARAAGVIDLRSAPEMLAEGSQAVLIGTGEE